jgi:hypothetical protein
MLFFGWGWKCIRHWIYKSKRNGHMRLPCAANCWICHISRNARWWTELPGWWILKWQWLVDDQSLCAMDALSDVNSLGKWLEVSFEFAVTSSGTSRRNQRHLESFWNLEPLATSSIKFQEFSIELSVSPSINHRRESKHLHISTTQHPFFVQILFLFEHKSVEGPFLFWG